jgi:hypothetical protein
MRLKESPIGRALRLIRPRLNDDQAAKLTDRATVEAVSMTPRYEAARG